MVVVAHDLTRRAVAALLEVAGFEVRTYLTAEAAIDGIASLAGGTGAADDEPTHGSVDSETAHRASEEREPSSKKGSMAESGASLVVASDALPGRPGVDVLSAAKRTGAKTVLLAGGAVGFAQDWPSRRGIDCVVPVREAPARLMMTLAQQMPTWWPLGPSPQRRELWAGVRSGPDGFDSLVAACSTAPVEDRQVCLRYLATVFPADQVLPRLERIIRENLGHLSEAELATAVDVALGLGGPGFDLLGHLVSAAHVPADLRIKCLDGLSRRAPPVVVVLNARNLVGDAAVGVAAAEAVLAAANDRGAEGFDDLVALAEGSGVPPSLRAAAVTSVGRSAPTGRVQAILSKWASGEDPFLADVALRPDQAASAARVGLATVLDDEQPPSVRARALAAMAPDAPHDLLQQALESLLESPSPELRRAATEWFMRRPDLDPTSVLRRATEDPTLERAALWGSTLAGRAGFEPLAHLVQHGRS